MLTPLSAIAVLVGTALWWFPGLLLLIRQRSTPSLDDFPDEPSLAEQAPRVSIVLPARNEAAHIVACVQSICASTWPNLELIVVDDHSTDDTGALARDAAVGDARVRIVSAPDLPNGWFGKQWACEVGASYATGSLLLFTDADTRHAPDLVGRTVAAREARGAELMSVAGHQDAVTIWEQAVQPSVFILILSRYGGGRAIEQARRAADVIANGQCFMMSRDGYNAVGRHEAVRRYVAEDLMMAQAVWRLGKRVSLVMGAAQLRTRMYDGLASLMRGWGKNIYAGGRQAVLGGAIGRALYPVLLPLLPIAMLAPFAMLAYAAVLFVGGAPMTASWLLVSLLTALGVLFTFAQAARINRDPLYRALLAPVGAAVLLVICLQSVWRGQRVEWKGRAYHTH